MDRENNWVILYTDSVPIHMGHKLVSKEITIKEQRKEQLNKLIVEIATKSDPFDTYSVVINELDYEEKFQDGQQVTAPFQDFGKLLIEILKKLRDPRQKYDAYLESLNSVKSNLAITYMTPFKNTNQLVIEVLKVSNDQLKDVVYSMIDNLKLKIDQLEERNNNLTKKLEEIEAEKTAENYHARFLQTIADQEERIFILYRQHDQKLEELERVNLENFINYQNEIKDEMRTLKLTNNSLQVLNRILETESVLVKKKLWKENKELRSTKKAKAQVDKDIKILKAKITKCNMELNDNHAHINYLQNENYQLRKNVDGYLNRLAELTSSLADMKNEYTNLHTMKEECIMKRQAIYSQFEVVERERRESNQRCLLVEERNKTLEKKHVDLIATLEHFRKEIKKRAATLEEYRQIIAAKNREHDKLLYRLEKLEEELKWRPAPPPDTDVGDAVGIEEGEPINKVPRCTVNRYLREKFPVERVQQ